MSNNPSSTPGSGSDESVTPSPVVVDIQSGDGGGDNPGSSGDGKPTPSTLPPKVKIAIFSAVTALSAASGDPNRTSPPPQVQRKTDSQIPSAGSGDVAFENCLDPEAGVYFEDKDSPKAVDTTNIAEFCAPSVLENQQIQFEGRPTVSGQECMPEISLQDSKSSTVLLVRGKIAYDITNSSSIELKEGKLCVAFQNDKGSLKINRQQGEVETLITTNDGSIVAEFIPQTDDKNHRILRVRALKNKVVIKQSERASEIVLNQDDQVYLPLSATDDNSDVGCSISLQKGNNGTNTFIFTGLAIAVYTVARSRKNSSNRPRNGA